MPLASAGETAAGGANSERQLKVRAHGCQVAGRDGSQPRRKHAIKLIMIGVIVTIAS